MDRWIGKVAVVTGASSGIGAAIACDLANAGMIVIGLARRKDRIEELSSQLPKSCKGKIIAFQCDVTKEENVKIAFAWIEKNHGGVDVLVNNAGKLVRGPCLVDENNTETIQSVVDVNIMGVVFCTREAFQSMKKRNVDGHIILINSTTGHSFPTLHLSLNIYPATKFAITALTELYSQEFNMLKTKIKITSVSPGLVDTELIPNESRKQIEIEKIPVLQVKDVADAVHYAIGTPPHVQVYELTIKPVGDRF